ncbi:type II toxin-antitoxin system VapC family toxin [Leptolyngbya sp. FACHB-36]|uniref:type II toxin-antitoxin system tRNA(fMet)-specific endonuclease VapC n=1 Tax=Leptolyngbya sp. FACHB-36 TaxID=2692808 RepID=UPI0016812BB1|nr:type II toxin-antitoxin system VapC family toxin [Leptolyngbya sp. FACHB-36]MBD2022469.1 type II toxin-antitoxin system VapC family toxin [Leptolyngbya sp. FACHB-36]
MIYLLDTNTCIVYLNQRVSSVRQRLEALFPEEIAVCSVVKAELFYGALRSNNPERTLAKQRGFLDSFVSLPFDDAAAGVYAQIPVQLEAVGTPIGPNDLLIAAIALANHLILVTHNTREFSRVEALRLDDWER